MNKIFSTTDRLSDLIISVREATSRLGYQQSHPHHGASADEPRRAGTHPHPGRRLWVSHGQIHRHNPLHPTTYDGWTPLGRSMGGGVQTTKHPAEQSRYVVWNQNLAFKLGESILCKKRMENVEHWQPTRGWWKSPTQGPMPWLDPTVELITSTSRSQQRNTDELTTQLVKETQRLGRKTCTHWFHKGSAQNHSSAYTYTQPKHILTTYKRTSESHTNTFRMALELLICEQMYA